MVTELDKAATTGECSGRGSDRPGGRARGVSRAGAMSARFCFEQFNGGFGALLLVAMVVSSLVLSGCSSTNRGSTQSISAHTHGRSARKGGSSEAGSKDTQDKLPSSSTTTTTTTLVAGSNQSSSSANCASIQLSASAGQGEAAAGTTFIPVNFTNHTDKACTLFGYPGIQLFGPNSLAIPTDVIRGLGTQDGGNPNAGSEPTLINLAPGKIAQFTLRFEDVPIGTETQCPESALAHITAPNDQVALTVPLKIAPCGGGTIYVSPVYALTGS